MIDNIGMNNSYIIKEVKKNRREKFKDEVIIDGASGNKIPEVFADIYSSLYNRYEDSSDVTTAEI